MDREYRALVPQKSAVAFSERDNWSGQELEQYEEM
jgi:hypothetical protein